MKIYMAIKVELRLLKNRNYDIKYIIKYNNIEK